MSYNVHDPPKQPSDNIYWVATDRARALLNALCASDKRLAGMSDAILGVDTGRVSEVGDISYILHKQGKN